MKLLKFYQNNLIEYTFFKKKFYKKMKKKGNLPHLMCTVKTMFI